MKIYRFNVESCLYLGEDFCRPEELIDEDGATAIAPPIPVPDHVPVYDRILGQWSLVPIDNLRKSVEPHE